MFRKIGKAVSHMNFMEVHVTYSLTNFAFKNASKITFSLKNSLSNQRLHEPVDWASVVMSGV